MEFYTIPELARELFPDWTPPRRSGESCKAPYREDKKESFSIVPGFDGRLCRDFSEGKTMNQIGFVARAFQIPPKPDACQKLIEMHQARCGGAGAPPPPPPARPEETRRERGSPKLPFLAEGAPGERIALAKLRHVCVEAVDCLVERGMVRFCNHLGHRCWVMTDSRRRAAQPRRLDGQLWFEKSKVISFPGSQGDWPCGIHDASRRQRIVIVEGGPDALAAMHFALAQGCEDSVGIVALLGAAVRIPDECIPFFGELHVRIFIHDDGEKESGMQAARAWAEQIRGTAGRVDGLTFDDLLQSDGEPVRDLNDLCSVDPVSYEARRDFLDGIMDF
jgi:hypothetical protein